MAAVQMVLSTITGSPGSIGSMIGPAAINSEKLANHEKRWRSYIDGIRSGNHESLARLYDESSPILYGLALRILSDPADAEEVVLDVYQQVWRVAKSFDESRGSVYGWLTVLTRSRAIDRLRCASSRRMRERPIAEDCQVRCKQPVPEEQTLLREERARVRGALAALSAEQREAIELAFFRGLTHVEVAEAMGVPLGTIKTRIRMGMRRMRDVLSIDSAAQDVQ